MSQVDSRFANRIALEQNSGVRFAEPGAVASAILYLASEAAEMITGANLLSTIDTFFEVVQF